MCINAAAFCRGNAVPIALAQEVWPFMTQQQGSHSLSPCLQRWKAQLSCLCAVKHLEVLAVGLDIPLVLTLLLSQVEMLIPGMHFNQMGNVKPQKLTSLHICTLKMKALAFVGNWEERENIPVS